MSPAEHGHEHGHEITIIVNARPKPVNQHVITFDEVVTLAFGTPNYETTVYTVTYMKGPPQNPNGELVRGQSVHIREGMVFDVIRTDKS